MKKKIYITNIILFLIVLLNTHLYVIANDYNDTNNISENMNQEQQVNTKNYNYTSIDFGILRNFVKTDGRKNKIAEYTTLAEDNESKNYEVYKSGNLTGSYDKLAEAVVSTSGQDTIKVMNDVVEDASTVVIPEKSDITLDTNGHSISNLSQIKNDGVLKIIGKGTLNSIRIFNYGHLYIDEVIFYTELPGGIINYTGTVNINNSHFLTTCSDLICNDDGTINIKEVNFEGSKEIDLDRTIRNSKNMSIENSTFSGKGRAIDNFGELNIVKCEFDYEIKHSYVIYSEDDAIINFNDSIISAKGIGMSEAIHNARGTLTMNNSTIYVESDGNEARGIESKKIANIENCNIKAVSNFIAYGIFASGEVLFKSGTIETDAKISSGGIEFYGDLLKIGEDDNNISNSSVCIIAKGENSYGVGDPYSMSPESGPGHIEFYDGTIKTYSDSSHLFYNYSDDKLSAPLNCAITKGQEDDNGTAVYTATLVPSIFWNSSNKNIMCERTSYSIDSYDDSAPLDDLKSFIKKYSSQVEKINFYTNSKVKLKAEDASQLFKDCYNLTGIYNINNLEMTDTTDISGMFENCKKLTSFDLSNLDVTWEKIKNMGAMFKGCSSLKKVEMIDTEINIGEDYNIEEDGTRPQINVSSLFEDCTALEEMNFTLKYGPQTVQDINSMFKGCRSLVKTNFKISTIYVYNMDSIFENCTNLKEIGWRGEHIIADVYAYYIGLYYAHSMKSAFKNCSSLESIDLRDFGNDGYFDECTKDAFLGTTSLKILYFSSVEGLNSDCGLQGEHWYNTRTGVTYTADELIKLHNDELNGTYINGVLDEHYYRTISQPINNLYEVHNSDKTMTGYCINKNRYGYASISERVAVNSEEKLLEFLCTSDEGSTHGTGNIGKDMRETIMSLVYYGYSYDADKIQKKYNLTDEEYQSVTQNAIWDYTDRYNNKSGPSMFEGNQLLAYNELVSKKYSDIPNADSLLFYVYDAKEETQQNLVSLASIDDKPYAGVEIKKVDENNQPLAGAIFGITNKNTGDVIKVTSNVDGIASICRADHICGLPVGSYTISEVEAPRGYQNSNDTFEFEVNDENANSIIQLGKKNDNNYEEIIEFKNTKDDTIQGGGIKITKVSDDGNKLANVKFSIYSDAQCNSELRNLVTNDDGIAMSGIKDFEAGTYYVKEIEGLDGFKMTEDIFPVTIENDKISELTVTNKVKTGKVSIEATKILEGDDISKYTFSFQLLDDKGTIIQTKTADKLGHVIFDEISLKMSEGTYKNYKIKEVLGNEEFIEYDAHTEDVTVMISDNGEENLICTPVYDKDGAVFTNKLLKSNVTVNKIVKGNKGDITREFKYIFTIDNEDIINATKTMNDNSTEIMKMKNGDSFTLKNGEKISFNIRRGSTYSIVEEETNYSTTVNGKNSNTYTSKIGESDEVIVYVNTLETLPLLGVKKDTALKYVVVIVFSCLLSILIRRVTLFRKQNNRRNL